MYQFCCCSIEYSTRLGCNKKKKSALPHSIREVMLETVPVFRAENLTECELIGLLRCVVLFKKKKKDMSKYWKCAIVIHEKY